MFSSMFKSGAEAATKAVASATATASAAKDTALKTAVKVKTELKDISFKELMTSESIIVRISFVLLVVFLFIVLLNLSLALVGWGFSSSSSPHLIQGMVDGRTTVIIPQDPSVVGSKPIERSVNARSGMEFTWSVWLYVENLEYLHNQYRHIFHKGEANIQTATETRGLNFPSNAPGLYIEPNTNSLCVIMNTQEVINKEIVIPDFPLHKWFNVMIRCRNVTVDVYINGTVVKSVDLDSVPRQNYGNVYVAMNGGFDGYLSNLFYYSYALSTGEIQNLVRRGADFRTSSASQTTILNTEYLSYRWYVFGQNSKK